MKVPVCVFHGGMGTTGTRTVLWLRYHQGATAIRYQKLPLIRRGNSRLRCHPVQVTNPILINRLESTVVQLLPGILLNQTLHSMKLI